MWLCQRECSPTPTTHESFCSTRPSASASPHTVYNHPRLRTTPRVESRFPLQNPDANFKRFTNLQIELGTRKTARTLRWVFGLG
jgi:hypothetical protein